MLSYLLTQAYQRSFPDANGFRAYVSAKNSACARPPSLNFARTTIRSRSTVRIQRRWSANLACKATLAANLSSVRIRSGQLRHAVMKRCIKVISSTLTPKWTCAFLTSKSATRMYSSPPRHRRDRDAWPPAGRTCCVVLGQLRTVARLQLRSAPRGTHARTCTSTRSRPPEALAPGPCAIRRAPRGHRPPSGWRCRRWPGRAVTTRGCRPRPRSTQDAGRRAG